MIIAHFKGTEEFNTKGVRSMAVNNEGSLQFIYGIGKAKDLKRKI